MGLIAAVVGSAVLSLSPADVPRPEIVETRTIDLTQTVTLSDIPRGTRRVRMWVPIPSDSAWQRVTDIKVEYAPGVWEHVRPTSGNGDFVYVEVLNPRTESLPVVVSCTVERQGVYFPIEAIESSGPVQPELFSDTLDPNAPLMGVDERTRALADEACGDETNVARQVMLITAKVAEVADHYSKNDSVPTCGRGAAGDCLDHGGGCCTDLHSLFISMCRARGIPARIQFGYRTLDSNDGKANVNPGYRCWAEAFIPGMGWVASDIVASDGAPDEIDYKWPAISSTRVWLWEGRSFELQPASSGGPAHTMLVGWAEVDGKVIEVLPAEDGTPSSLSRTISFKVISNDRTPETPALPQ